MQFSLILNATHHAEPRAAAAAAGTLRRRDVSLLVVADRFDVVRSKLLPAKSLSVIRMVDARISFSDGVATFANKSSSPRPRVRRRVEGFVAVCLQIWQYISSMVPHRHGTPRGVQHVQRLWQPPPSWYNLHPPN